MSPSAAASCTTSAAAPPPTGSSKSDESGSVSVVTICLTVSGLPPRCAAEVRPRCGRGAAEVRPKCGRGVAEVQPGSPGPLVCSSGWWGRGVSRGASAAPHARSHLALISRSSRASVAFAGSELVVAQAAVSRGMARGQSKGGGPSPVQLGGEPSAGIEQSHSSGGRMAVLPSSAPSPSSDLTSRRTVSALAPGGRRRPTTNLPS